MGILADMVLRVGMDIKEVKTGMTEVQERVEGAGTGWAKFGTLAMGAGVVAAGAITGIAAFGLEAVHHATEAGQAAYELSEKFGLLPAQASRWLAVAGQLGISGEQIGKGFQFLSKNVTAMQLTLDAGGKLGKVQGEVYKELGINVLTAGGRVKDADTLMLEAADAFKGLEDGPAKAALAMKLFGKSGTDMLPVLNQGSEGLRKMMADGQSLGVVMSGPQVEAAHKLFLEQQRLNVATQGITTQIGLFLMPVMTRIMDYIIGTAVPAVGTLGTYFMQHLWPAIQQVWAFFMQALGPAIQYIRDHFENLKPVLIALGVTIGLMAAVAAIAIGIVVLAVVGLVVGVTWLSGQIAALIPRVGGWFSWLGSQAQSVAQWIQSQWNALIGFFGGLPGRISAIGSLMWNGLTAGFRAVINSIIGIWNRLHFSTPGVDFLGQHFPSQTFYVPQVPYMHFGGIVPGAPGTDVLTMLRAGERVTAAGSSNGPLVVHIHIDQGAIIDGPSIDYFTNKIAQRLRHVPGH